MKILTCASTGQSISLMRAIATSGEGEVWQTDLDGYLAKIYHAPTPERIRKLEVMVAHPPQDPNAHINHLSFAWPKSLLLDARNQPVGFLMPQILESVDLLDVYNPQRRHLVTPGFDWLYLHVTAMNVASIVWAIHHAGYVLGDIKPQNILVNRSALPAIIDTDSFQVRHPDTGELYRCMVGSESFTPPELLGQDLAATTQTDVHDRFRLGVIIYQLLFGDYPFKGKWTQPGDSPSPPELVRQGFWPYAPNSPIQRGPLTVPLETVHSDLQRCFLRCFNTGHRHPELRPTPREWVQALKLAIADLEVCRKVPQHRYSKTYGHCYWCQRRSQLGIDVFPKLPDWRDKLKTQVTQQARAGSQAVGDKVQQLGGTWATWHQQRLGNNPVAIAGQSHRSLGQPLSAPANLPRPSIAPKPSRVGPGGQPLQPLPLPDSNRSQVLDVNWSKIRLSLGIVAVLMALMWLGYLHLKGENTVPTDVGASLLLGLGLICLLGMRFLNRNSTG